MGSLCRNVQELSLHGFFILAQSLRLNYKDSNTYICNFSDFLDEIKFQSWLMLLNVIFDMHKSKLEHVFLYLQTTSMKITHTMRGTLDQ